MIITILVVLLVYGLVCYLYWMLGLEDVFWPITILTIPGALVATLIVVGIGDWWDRRRGIPIRYI